MTLQIIENLEQGSKEWLKARLGVATASCFKKIITSAGNKSTSLPQYALELASEILLLEPDQGYQNDNMIRGNELEAQAREYYQEFTFNDVRQVGFMSCGDYGYSPDGLIGEDGLLEIKCPTAITHTKYLADNKMPSEYVSQVQGGLFVSNRKWIDFVSYHPNFKEKKLFIKRVYRDEEFIHQLSALINEVINRRNQILERIKNNGKD